LFGFLDHTVRHTQPVGIFQKNNQLFAETPSYTNTQVTYTYYLSGIRNRDSVNEIVSSLDRKAIGISKIFILELQILTGDQLPWVNSFPQG